MRFPGVNLTAILEGITIGTEAFLGFLPIFCFLCTTSKTPKSLNSNRSPEETQRSVSVSILRKSCARPGDVS